MTLASKLETLNKLRPLSPESVASLQEAWDVRMIYESNSIEGNSLTLRETEIVLSQGVTVSGKPLKDHIDTIQLSKAWDSIKKIAAHGSDFTESQLLDLHAIVMPDHSGGYRDGAVRIAGASHVPPNPVKIPDLVETLFAESSDLVDPVEKAAKIHHGISAIHPFFDGNGRTARLAMNFILIASGYPPVSISPELRQDYYNALEAADNGDFPTWQAFIETQLHQELETYLKALSN